MCRLSLGVLRFCVWCEELYNATRVITTRTEHAIMSRAVLKISGLCAVAILASCAAEPPPFQLRALQQNERDRAREVQTRAKRPLPTTLESPFLTSGNTPKATPPPT